MYFKQILNEECGCSSYIVASRRSKEAAIIDPALDIRHYLDLARDREFTIRYIIDTHIHADHISGNRKLAAATDAALCLHESADVLFPFEPLKDGQEIRLGQLILTILHTPGHRPEAISILVTNPPRSAAPGIVLSGDTLFVGDVGRPDFGGPEGARNQYRSVHKLLGLDDFVEVFPAHFEGSCGRGMCGRPSTTIGFERRFNPILQLSEADFVAYASEPPARPLNMEAILATNRGEAEIDWAQPHTTDVRSLTPAEAQHWLKDHQAAVIDVREPQEYAAGHLPGALLIPQAELATRIAEVPRNRDLLVVCASGMRSLRSAQFLKHYGFPRVVNLSGGTNGWIEAALPVDSGPRGA
ncbi:MAG TPA: MBL fold metallo-hydrolase [Dehalococcoidia bacterium]|nr:MBL fold metallo-hydrolase [Dehalococcoidia bacterium]